MTTQADFADSAAVRTWFSGLEDQWGEPLSANERREKLSVLQRFLDGSGETPDTWIRQCILVKDGARKISVKGRRRAWEAIRAFQDEHGRQAGNTILSFFIHNGIMLQASV